MNKQECDYCNLEFEWQDSDELFDWISQYKSRGDKPIMYKGARYSVSELKMHNILGIV